MMKTSLVDHDLPDSYPVDQQEVAFHPNPIQSPSFVSEILEHIQTQSIHQQLESNYDYNSL